MLLTAEFSAHPFVTQLDTIQFYELYFREISEKLFACPQRFFPSSLGAIHEVCTLQEFFATLFRVKGASTRRLPCIYLLRSFGLFKHFKQEFDILFDISLADSYIYNIIQGDQICVNIYIFQKIPLATETLLKTWIYAGSV